MLRAGARRLETRSLSPGCGAAAHLSSSPILPRLFMSPLRHFRLVLASLFLTSVAFADGPADNIPEHVRPIPPPGIKLSPDDRAGLETGAGDLSKEIESLRVFLKSKPALLALLPDVEVYHKAVDWALRYDEFFKPQEIAIARDLLRRGSERAQALRAGKTPWITQTGLVVRGYRSKIDGSVQPFGLVIPASYTPGAGQPTRVDFWCHGRGETLSELAFVDQRQKTPGQFTPPDAIVVHLYGRYCCANKFAGEVDLFEALDQVKRTYNVDENRLVVRGFSMGGASTWQFAVHYPATWCAAAPGAGFAETADFLRFFQDEKLEPTWFERKLWHLYDSTDYAVNLSNCPTVAYSGEIDRQKQAADRMAKALQAEGMELTHIIGPKTAHAYHPEAMKEIARRVDAIAHLGRNPAPEKIHFTTWTLRYNQCFWLTLDALEKHWDRARVDAGIDRNTQALHATTRNVAALTYSFEPGLCPFDTTRTVEVVLDGQALMAPPPQTDRSWLVRFTKTGGKWTISTATDDTAGALAKRHGLQGPIDDAFLDSFLMVRPTGAPLNEKVGQWAEAEMTHAIDHWRKQFRGIAATRADTEITDEDIASHNLVLWGDPQSNKLLARIADRLPISWTAEGIKVGDQTFTAADHVPVLIFPNPLNQARYVVLNSGFTYREYDYLSNARQVPKFPDYAIVDITKPVTSQAPGGIAAAGFFGEHWELLPNDGQ
jgi:Prolyl oligopeptidase family